MKYDGQCLFQKRLVGFGIAEEIGDPDEKLFKERINLLRHISQIGNIVRLVLDLEHSHSALNPAQDCIMLIAGKIVAGLRADEDEDFLERINRFCLGLFEWMGKAKRRTLGVSQEIRWHLVRRQHIIREAGSNGVSGHAVVLCCFRILHQYQSAFTFDSLETKRALGARARQDDAYGLLALVLCQPPEKKINRMPQASVLHGIKDLERSVQN